MSMTALLTRREPPMPPDIPSTRMSCGTPLPTIDMMVSNSSSPGIAIQASTNRCTTRSNLPPKNPEAPPISTATATLSRGRCQTDDQRQTRSVDDAAEHVSSQVVGTERIRGRGAGQPVRQMNFEILVGGQEVGEERDEYHYQDDDRATGAE